MITHSIPQSPPASAGRARHDVGPAVEYFRTILRQLPQSGPAARPAVVALTSCHRGEGVTTVAAQTALAAASAEMSVLLVDANLEHPRLHDLFRAERGPGLTDVLHQTATLGEVLQETGHSGVRLLAAGRREADLSALFDSGCWHELFDAARREFGLTIVDLPPAAENAAAARLAGVVDGVILVIEAERVRWEVAARAKELLQRADASILGAVLNKRREHVPGWLYRML